MFSQNNYMSGANMLCSRATSYQADVSYYQKIVMRQICHIFRKEQWQMDISYPQKGACGVDTSC